MKKPLNLKVSCLVASLALVMSSSCTGQSLFSADEQPKSETGSLMNPHTLPAKGPWFEGWYARFVPDTAGDNSTLGVIVGSVMNQKLTRRQVTKNGLPGFASLLIGNPGRPLQVVDEFLDETKMTLSNGKRVFMDPIPSKRAGFEWSSKSHRLSESEISLQFENGISLEAKMFSPKTWGPGAHWGLEGPISLAKFFPLHWFIYSLSSKAVWTLTSADGKSETKTGHVHFEKNWGKKFPSSYLWSQGLSTNGKKGFVIAGGQALEEAPLEAFLAVVSDGESHYPFAPNQAGVHVSKSIDACAGKYTIELLSTEAQVTISAQAQRKTFSDILIPTDNGFEPHSEQSFMGSALVEVKPFGKPKSQFEISNVALEFGGQLKCNRNTEDRSRN